MHKASANEETMIFFSELLAQGQDAWDNWFQNVNKQPNLVILKDIDFKKYNIKPNFSNFIFEKGSILENIVFDNDISFANSKFNEDIQFKNIRFEKSADFTGSTFQNIEFTYIFYNALSFEGAKFEGDVTFQTINYIYHELAATNEKNITFSFCNAKFYKKSKFKDVLFYQVDFSGALFCGDAVFKNSSFIKFSNFKNAFFSSSTEFYWCQLEECDFGIEKNSIKTIREELKKQNIKNVEIRSLPKFISVRFKEKFSSSLRIKETCYRASVFEFVPDLGTNEEISKTDITHIIIEPFTKINSFSERLKQADSNIIKDLRRLRIQVSQTGATELEAQLFLEELKCEQYLHLANTLIPFSKFNRLEFNVKIKLIFSLFLRLTYLAIDNFYYIISNYGRSIIRPLLCIFTSFFVFRFIYLKIFSEVWKNSPHFISNKSVDKIVTLDEYNEALNVIVIANHIPIVGSLTADTNTKNILFCGHVPATYEICAPPILYDIMLVFQNIFVGLLIFLFGLAIRNYFKIK